MSLCTLFARLRGEKTFDRGIHPHDWKELSADAAVEVLPTPAAVTVPLVQHIGAPCVGTVKPRTTVEMGDVLGQAEAFVSAPVHSPIRGTTALETMVTLANGRHVPAIPVKAEGEQLTGPALFEAIFGGDWPTEGLDAYEPDTIVQAIQAAGLVGMGGAGFPTHVKLKLNPHKPVDTLLVNGCECEPYLTADHRLMLEAPRPRPPGARRAAGAAGATRVAVAIEDNKPQAIAALQQAAEGTGVEIVPTATRYPMGGEKQTILAVLGREVPTGGLPLDVGVVVVNVGTTAAIARAVVRGQPLTHRIITVTGRGVNRPCNVLAPVGVSMQELIDFAGGLNERARRVVSGGPMMGFAVQDLSTPVTKGTSGITVLIQEDVDAAPETACVRCGRCVDVCPVGLVPTRIAMAVRNKDWETAKKYNIMACIECGCCGYACPASIPLVQIIRAGKAMMPRE